MDVNGNVLRSCNHGSFSFTTAMLLTVQHEDCKAQDSQYNK